MIPGSGRSAGEEIGYPLQYSLAFLVTQVVKNPPAMQETWVRSLGWEDPLEKGKATHSTILAWRIPWTVHSKRSQRVGHDFHFHVVLQLRRYKKYQVGALYPCLCSQYLGLEANSVTGFLGIFPGISYAYTSR